MPHKAVLEKTNTAFVIVDVQEAFRDAIPDFKKLVARIAMAAKGFYLLGVPVIVTEQYPKGLGKTAKEITKALPKSARVFEKTKFSSCGADEFMGYLKYLGVNQIVICGIETHICVNQTVHDLLNEGFQVHLLIDCIASRIEINKQTGTEKMKMHGAIPANTEMAFFELMRDSKHEKFKEIQALIK